MNSLYHFRKKLGAKGIMLLIVAFILVTTGCTKVTSGSAKSDKEIVIAVSTDVGIDQMDAGSYKGNMAAYPMIYDSLVEYGEKGEIVPSLAEAVADSLARQGDPAVAVIPEGPYVIPVYRQPSSP